MFRASARTIPPGAWPRAVTGVIGSPCGPTYSRALAAVSVGTGAGCLAVRARSALGSVVVHSAPRPASNTNAAAVRFIRTYSGRCALVGRRRALGSRGRGMSKLRVIVGSGTPATLNKTGKPGTAGLGPALGWGLWVAVDLSAGQ